MKSNSNTLKYLAITLVVILFAAVIGMTGIGIGYFAGQISPMDAVQASYSQDGGGIAIAFPEDAEVIDAPENFDVFWEAYDLMEKHFDGDVPEGSEITYAAIDSLMEFVGSCETDLDTEALQFIPPRTPGDAPANFSFFWQTANRLYADCGGSTPEPEQLVHVAIHGVIERLDNRYTNIMPPLVAEQFRIDMESGFEGIGATVEPTDEENRTGVRIVKPFEGSPAELAGLLPKDVILAVDDEDVTAMLLDEAVRLIRGPKGEKVVLLVQRGEEEPYDVEVIRDRVEIPILRSEITDDNLLHIMLADFSTRSGEEVKQALEDGIKAGVQGVILDLRGNPGGRLDMSINIASLFIEDGVIVSESGEKEIDHKAKGKALVPDLPVVVLVDGGSASASEIVAGAIQDHERGALIGETTFGKGSVQRLFNLSDDSILKVTVAKWYTPDGRLIDGEGLEPDIVVPFEFDPDQPELDPQFDAAMAYLLDLLKSE